MSKVVIPANLEGKSFLIAGAAGFVPSHVAEFFLERGARVVGVDNFITGSQYNIDRISHHKNFSFHKCNVYIDLPKFEDEKFDFILSLASPASPIDFFKIPLEIMRVNSEGTLNLLKLAQEKGARFLEASTSEVYGDPEIHPQVETYVGNVNPIGPRSCYDESKRFAEALTMTYHRYYEVDTRIIRIFNTYGPGMRADDGRVIPNFVNQALKGEDLTIYGDGSQTRSFCFVDDLVKAMAYVLFSDDPTPFNIGNPDEYTIKQTAELIIEALGSSSKLSFSELPKDDPKKRRPDLTKLQSICDYKPEISFQDGIARTAQFFKDRF